MDSGLIIIIISLIILAIIIYILNDKEEIEKIYNNINQKINKKIKKIIFVVVIIAFILFIVSYCINSIKQTINYGYLYQDTVENNEMFEECDKKMSEENLFYKDIIQNDYGDVLKEPYIPDGFEYVEGDINSGYVIQDLDGNQYVWVPCTNKDDESVVKLEKRNFSNSSSVWISYYTCYDIEYEKFLISALENGGFYVSRYELGIEGDTLVSKHGAEIYSNTNRDEVIEKLSTMYDTVNCNIINGYAYDTTLTWIENSNEVVPDAINYQEVDTIYCGRNMYNNIYDFIDNVMEITLEDCYGTIIYRGFDYSEDLKYESRYNLNLTDYAENWREEHNIKQINALTYRTVLYK